MLGTLGWPDVAVGAGSMLAIVTAVLSLWWGVVQIRQAAPAKPGNPGKRSNPGNPHPCGEHGVRLVHLEAEADRARDARERTFQTLDEHGQRLARIEGGVVEIKGLLTRGA